MHVYLHNCTTQWRAALFAAGIANKQTCYGLNRKVNGLLSTTRATEFPRSVLQNGVLLCSVCYIPPAPFKPTLMLTPHGMSDKYSNTGMPAQPQPQHQVCVAAGCSFNVNSSVTRLRMLTV